MEEVNKVKEIIDTRQFNNPRGQLDSRTWLLHWCLFPFFNHNEAKDTLIDMFFSPNYINTIQILCPWILRYLTAAVITNRKRSKNSNSHQKHLKDLIRIIKQEHQYSDPLTDFVRALYMEFDFEDAQKQLSAAEQILKEDFFLTSSTEDFVDAARQLITESYCKIYQRIDMR
jgi:translation initiation factor 3 subunit E